MTPTATNNKRQAQKEKHQNERQQNHQSTLSQMK